MSMQVSNSVLKGLGLGGQVLGLGLGLVGSGLVNIPEVMIIKGLDPQDRSKNQGFVIPFAFNPACLNLF